MQLDSPNTMQSMQIWSMKLHPVRNYLKVRCCVKFEIKPWANRRSRTGPALIVDSYGIGRQSGHLLDAQSVHARSGEVDEGRMVTTYHGRLV